MMEGGRREGEGKQTMKEMRLYLKGSKTMTVLTSQPPKKFYCSFLHEVSVLVKQWLDF